MALEARAAALEKRLASFSDTPEPSPPKRWVFSTADGCIYESSMPEPACMRAEKAEEQHLCFNLP